ncbi:CD225/dispanin family protein [Empedobacter sedimenti]|uniref:CD225/dispanin family protein n=1 Tax=Empedobacter sedimenti TaxID=3042610 RepID=UPI0024A6D512|nr:CD225/dispanin family protein [Empedobacter sedimenti]
MNDQPNEGLKQFENGTPPDNNLVWAILSTVLCCLPLGIVSIIKSTSVNTLWAQGQYDAARQAAADAKKFAIWGVAAAAIGIVLYIIFIVVLGVGSAALGGSNGY